MFDLGPTAPWQLALSTGGCAAPSSVLPSALEVFMLTPTADPLARDLRVGGDHILETRQEHAVEEQWSLACRTLLAVHLLRRPSVLAP